MIVAQKRCEETIGTNGEDHEQQERRGRGEGEGRPSSVVVDSLWVKIRAITSAITAVNTVLYTHKIYDVN